jgi:putative flippase GtrA
MNQVRRFVSFAAVGAFGFLVDAGTLWLAMQYGGAGPVFGRVISYLAAATTAWALNRNFTFQNQYDSLLGQWLRFLILNAVGGAVNFGVYLCLMKYVLIVSAHPTLGVGAGSFAGLVFNFALSQKLVFTPVKRLPVIRGL